MRIVMDDLGPDLVEVSAQNKRRVLLRFFASSKAEAAERLGEQMALLASAEAQAADRAVDE